MLNCDLDLGISLVKKAIEKEREERLFQQWVAQLPVMAITDNPVSFSDYKDRATGANIDLRPRAEIEQELDEVEKEIREGGS